MGLKLTQVYGCGQFDGGHTEIEADARPKGKSFRSRRTRGTILRPDDGLLSASGPSYRINRHMSTNDPMNSSQPLPQITGTAGSESPSRQGFLKSRFTAGLSAVTLALLFATAVGCRSTPKVVGSMDGPYDLTLVLPGDVISISFPAATNLNTTLKVPVDGEVRLPAAFGKPVNASGKTRAELEKALLAEFGSQLRSPEVNVSLITSAAVVYISGAVLAPNRVAMDRPLTLLDAIMEAGGPDSTRAKLDSVAVVRNFHGVQQTYVLDMRQAFGGGEVTPFYLRPFDSIVVPARKFNF